MLEQLSSSRMIRFGVFEVDLAAGELRKGGVKIKLRDQPFRVLVALLARSGEVVTREELREKLWRDGTFVDFDRGVNTAVNKIRGALGDSAGRPRFVETLPRRGYRFVAPVEGAASRAASVAQPHRLRRKPFAVALAIGAAFAVGIGVNEWISRSTNPAPMAESQVVKFAVAPGQSIHDPRVSPDGRRIAFVTFEDEGALWIRDLSEETPRRVADSEGARRPFWSPDSRFVAFGSGDSLKRLRVSGDGLPTEICKVPTGTYRGGAWRPDGEEIVFPGNLELYRVRASGGEPELLETVDWRWGSGLRDVPQCRTSGNWSGAISGRGRAIEPCSVVFQPL